MKTIDRQEAVRLVSEGMNLTAEERKRLADERLRELVAYVREKSPYFKKHYENIPDNFTLTDLPMTEKKVLLAHYQEWITDPELTKEKVLAYVGRDVHDMSLLLGKYTALKTSGSTGEPLPMVRDDYHNKIHGALIGLRFMKGVDPSMMDQSKHKIAAVIYTSGSSSSYTSFLRAQAAMPDYADNMIAVQVVQSVDKIVAELNEFQPEVVSGYPSVLVALAIEKQKGNLNIPVKVIFCSAELLTDENYRLLKDTFGCMVKNNYCMTEGGEIAMTHECGHLHLNDDWIIVEPVDINGNPVTDENEWSDGILVTDLSNYVQPIIRYYVNDRVRIKNLKQDCSSLPVLEIQGRYCEPCSICGIEFTTMALDSWIEDVPGLCSYQFIQKAENILEIRGVIAADKDYQSVADETVCAIYKVLCDQGCKDLKVLWSKEPMIHNTRGGKVPIYIREDRKS